MTFNESRATAVKFIETARLQPRLQHLARSAISHLFDETLPDAPYLEDVWVHLIEPQVTRLFGSTMRDLRAYSVERHILTYLGFLEGMLLIPAETPPLRKDELPTLRVSVESWWRQDGTWTP